EPRGRRDGAAAGGAPEQARRALLALRAFLGREPRTPRHFFDELVVDQRPAEGIGGALGHGGAAGAVLASDGDDGGHGERCQTSDVRRLMSEVSSKQIRASSGSRFPIRPLWFDSDSRVPQLL